VGTSTLEGYVLKTEGNKSSRRRPPRFDLIGGPVCLDFINTLDDRFSSEPKELLKDYIDLARFGEDTGTLDPLQVDRLFEASQRNPEAAKKALESAIQLREAIYAVVWAIVTKKPVPRAALLTVNQYAQGAAQHLLLVETKGPDANAEAKAEVKRRFEWRYDDTLNSFSAPLWPIARSAADLLASDELQFVRACASETCQWLFLDVSKNHARRWCDMTRCGNRAKFRAYYKRQKKA
jgi:predicted RNA-binding Zn ribbon-like protein